MLCFIFNYIEILPSSCDNYAMDLVFLSQSAMQLCGFSLGYPVLVETSQYTTVLKAWPTTEGSLTSVGLCIEGWLYFNIIWLCLKIL